tara:strand:+ start:3872 stop:4327 length:456 start_codon:yes stop_codon:yes gene_type:complete
MNNFLKNKYIIFVSRLILGIVFIYASIDKIIDPVSFSDTIDNYHISPYSLNNLAALIIPWIELLIGICLIFGIYIEGASSIAIFLLLFFIFIISQALARGINIDCGCFDLNSKNLEDVDLRIKMIRRIVEDFLFLALAFLINIYNKKIRND